MSTASKTRRRWFQFSLGTMLVLVTILAISAGWITHSLNWIRKRHQMSHETAVWRWPDLHSSAPGGLWLFGEPGYPELTLWYGDDSGDMTRSVQIFEDAFPETKVRMSYQEGATK
jgi:hypothetical protein